MSKNSSKSKATGAVTGIKCDAKNCVHHYGECECSAPCICVGSSDACKCRDTECDTFEMRKDTI